MKDNKEFSMVNVLIASQSYIDTLDELKDSPFYVGDIKILVNQLLNKIQSKYKKQFKYMFSEEHAETSLNMLRDYEKFNNLYLHEKQIVAQMSEYYIEDPTFWQENFIIFFDKLNAK